MFVGWKWIGEEPSHKVSLCHYEWETDLTSDIMVNSYYLLHGVSEGELVWSKLFYVQGTEGYSNHIMKGGEGNIGNLMGA